MRIQLRGKGELVTSHRLTEVSRERTVSSISPFEFYAHFEGRTAVKITDSEYARLAALLESPEKAPEVTP
jgi:hypothetical protein